MPASENLHNFRPMHRSNMNSDSKDPSNHGAGAGYFACLAGQAASENNAYSAPAPRPTRKDCPRRTRYGMPPDADPEKGSTVIFPAKRPARSVENAITIS